MEATKKMGHNVDRDISKVEKEGIKDTGLFGSFGFRFFSLRLVSKKARGFLRKLSNRVGCFGKDSAQASSLTKSIVSEVLSCETVDTAPVLSGNRQEVPNDGHIVSVHIPSADENTGTKPGDTHNKPEEILDEAEEDWLSGSMLDEIPHRVRCKVDSQDDLSVIAKGMVICTLKKLQSTDSFLFKEFVLHDSVQRFRS